MAYLISQTLGECIELPTLVLDRLQQAPEEAVRIALYILKNKQAVPEELCGALGLSPQVVDTALTFWAGAGLIYLENTPPPAPVRRRMTQGEVVFAAQNNQDIAGLLDAAQMIMGDMLAPNDAATLVTLHMEDGLPPDLILASLSYFVQDGRRSMRYIERRLLSMKRDGIATLEALENYIRLTEIRKERELLVAALLEASSDSFTAAQCRMIATWYEEYGYGDDMVEQGALRCGANRSVKYLNGILRNWYKTGVRTLADIPDTYANLAAAPTHLPEDDFVVQRMRTVPVFKK